MSSNKFIARNGLAVGTTPVDIVDSTGTILVNAPTATKLQTARTISLSGDVAGTVSFDGTGNVDISTTVQPNSVALGTDTTGNYMVNVAAGTGVSVSHTQGEGSTATVSIGQAVGTTDNVTFNNVTVNGTLTSDDITSTNISVAGNATITGNLTVSGTTTTVNSTTVAIADLNLELAKNATTAAQANGAGITIDGPATPATLTYTSADDRWNLNKNLNVTTIYGALSGNASTASTWQTARTLSYTGDATGSMSVNGSADVSAALTLANSGVTAGTYNNVTVDAKGRVTSGSNTSYLTSYTETSTLANVTARGASTTTNIQVNNLKIGNNAYPPDSAYQGLRHASMGAASNEYMIISANANTYISAASGSNVTIRPNANDSTNELIIGTGTSGLTYRGSAVWHAGNLTNLNQLTNGPGYITGESDTLSTVTGRGSSTSTRVTLSGGWTVPDSTTNYMGTVQTTDYTTMTFMARAWSSVQGTNGLAYTFNTHTNAGGGGHGALQIYYGEGGKVQAPTSFRAPTFYDSDDTNYYIDPNNHSKVNTFGVGGSPVNSSTKLSVSGTSHFPDEIYTGGTAGSLNSWGARWWTTSGQMYWGSNGANFTNYGYGTQITTLNIASSGSVTAYADLRAPIFYDSNDTGYYVDPAASTSLRTVGDWRANASTWTGEFSGKIQYHSNNWYFQAADQFIWRNSGGSNVVYGDQSGNHWAIGSSRSPIFYDSDDTGYYLNPNSGSNLKYLQVSGDWGSSPFGSGHETFTIRSTYASFVQRQTNGNLGYWLHHIPSDGTYMLYGGRGATDGSSWDWSLRAYPSQDGNRVEIRSDLRSPIFYDYNDTTYYVDPNNTSTSAVFAGNISMNGVIVRRSAGTGYLSGNYSSSETTATTGAIYTIGGSYYPTSTSLNNIYGIGYTYAGVAGGAAGSTSSSAWGLYVASNGSTRVFLDSDNGRVLSTGDMRSPIYYDYNDTGKYVDPNASSNLNAVYITGYNSASSALMLNWPTSGYIGLYGSVVNSAKILNLRGTSGDSYPVSVATLGGFASVAGDGTNGQTSAGIILAPQGGQYATTTSSVTGAIKVRLPNFTNDAMFTMTIRVYTYDTSSFEITCGGYPYSNTSWTNTFAYMNCENRGNLTVRFGYDGTGACVWIGETSSTWTYPQVHVMDFTVGYYGRDPKQYSAGWSTTFETSFNTVVTSRTAYRQLREDTWISGNKYFGSDGAIYGTIFYDANDSTYYCNPNGNTLLSTLDVGGNIGGKLDIYAGGAGGVGWGTGLNIGDSSNYTTWIQDAGVSRFRNLGTGGHDWYNSSAGTRTMFLDNSGNVTFAGSITANSDIRLKTNIKQLTNGLEIVRKLRGVSFDWIESGEHSIGVIAQEVEAILPEVVLTTQERKPGATESREIKAVDYSKMVSVLIEAIKEQQSEIDELKALVKQLLAK